MAFIGLGGQGRGHLAGGAWTYSPGGYLARPNVQVRAVCDVRRDRRDEAARHSNTTYAGKFQRPDYRDVTAYNDFREVLARPDIDAVLRHARGEDEAGKQAALQSLLLLAAPETLGPLIDLTLAAKSDAERRKSERVVDEICRSAARREGGSPEPAAALERILPRLRDPKRLALVADVALIVANSLVESDPELAARAAREILKHTQSEEVKARARELLVRLRG